MLYRRLVRRPEGGVRVTLPTVERSLLIDMASTLRSVVSDVDADTPHDDVTGRLFPRAYEDPLEQMQYAESMMGPLAESKRTLLDTFVESLFGGDLDDRRWRTDLDDAQTSAWLAVLQDGRLVLSRAVGIETEEDWERLHHTDDEAALVLDYLGELLNTLVMLLMGTLPDPE
ncbi:MAG TPA: DUF2017 family protein [Euzebya sp.]|nr:DUF2017 family protein [Euzebya sp.]